MQVLLFLVACLMISCVFTHPVGDQYDIEEDSLVLSGNDKEGFKRLPRQTSSRSRSASYVKRRFGRSLPKEFETLEANIHAENYDSHVRDRRQSSKKSKSYVRRRFGRSIA